MAVQSKKPVAPKASAKVAAKKEPTAKAVIAKVKKNLSEAETKIIQAEQAANALAEKVAEKKLTEAPVKKDTSKPASAPKPPAPKKAAPAKPASKPAVKKPAPKKTEVKKPQSTKAPAPEATPKVTQPKEKTSRDMVSELLQENEGTALLANHRPATPAPAVAEVTIADRREYDRREEDRSLTYISAPNKKREVPPLHSAPGTVSMTRVLSRISGQGESDQGRDLPRFKLR